MPASRTPSTSRTSEWQQSLIALRSRRITMSLPPSPNASELSKPSDEKYFNIRSSDNAGIQIHSDVLQFYFPKLYHDCATIPSCEIALPYSSHALCLIVQFLSCGSFRPTPYVHLGECFHAAKAYQLDSLTTCLRSELSHPKSAFYIGNYPIQAYSICSTCEFEEEKKLAFQRCIGKIDFSNSAFISSISQKCQTPTIALDLITRLSRRNIVILKFFSALHTHPLDLRSKIRVDNAIAANDSDFTCASCRTDAVFNVPSWIVSWAHFAKAELLGKPGAECAQVFRVEFMSKQRNAYDLFQNDDFEEADRDIEAPVCRACLKKILIDSPSRWEAWAGGIEELLRGELGDDY